MLRNRAFLELLKGMEIKCIYNGRGSSIITQNRYALMEEIKENKLYLIKMVYMYDGYNEVTHSLFLPSFDNNSFFKTSLNSREAQLNVNVYLYLNEVRFGWGSGIQATDDFYFEIYEII